MKTIKFLLFIIIFMQVKFVDAQLPIDFSDKTYKNNVQTVLLHPVDEPLGLPVILLNDPHPLKLSFDVLGDIAFVYYYKLIHCTFDWKPSNLQPGEYLEGFDYDQINDYRFSLNTLTPYVHHTLTFPSEYLKPKLSGNYLLVVYEDVLKEGNILLTKRLMVIDPKVSIKASVPQYARNPDFTKTMHQLDIEVLTSGETENFPGNSFHVAIRQNGRWDNAITDLQPSHTYSDRLLYEYIDETVFEAGNQWRNFDMKSFKYQSEHIQRIFSDEDYFTVKLWEDQRRNRKVYISEPDIFGNKLIQARQDQDTDIEGDYAWVEFFLHYDAPLTHGEMFVLGALNDWNLTERNKMKYNYPAKGYEASLFLKQGYYNYLYGIREFGEKHAEVALIEGTYWETLNEYLILVYFRKPGTSYDQLIASSIIKSHS
ncbi:MAG: hypothetical protein CVT92_01365 [Bacteroidetes bacterium HGW-Bacteroidetes-1]|jgi:hypothetical protein|nr:MAG: hypothetical protein CVT92_01365 [Bacteroidetes bacterium HGW-Bacteroidetes-1]